MIRLGLILGLYVLAISFLGFFSLQRFSVGLVSITFLFIFLYELRRLFLKNVNSFRTIHLGKSEKILLVLIVLSCLVNLIGALSPETAFDGLWYHLTLPKLYILSQKIYHIPGGLLYYSGLPKFVEILYIPQLMFFSEIQAKLVHFCLGMLSLAALFAVSRRILDSHWALFSVAVFAGNIVFAWETTTAYSDLGWVFYEILAFTAFFGFLKTKKSMWLVLLGFMLGFALLTKLTAVISIAIYLILLVVLWRERGNFSLLKQGLTVAFCAVLPVLPWIIFNYASTGNPLYPFFTDYLRMGSHLSLEPGLLIRQVLFPADPVSPVYLIFLPLVFLLWRKLDLIHRIVFIYVLLSFLGWLVISATGGSRFLLAYLPVYSIGVVMIIKKFSTLWGVNFYKLSLFIVALLLSVCIAYRFTAQLRYLPYLTGQESKSDFLTKNLNFSFGDFYDSDGYFAENIRDKDLVLLLGPHNLFYVNFPYVHESWYKGEKITHIIVQNRSLPAGFNDFREVYRNGVTNVVLYQRLN